MSKVELTHLDKVYWPKNKITKGELIDYYQKIAPNILPYLKDRPENLLRNPGGIDEKGFYQRNLEDHPSWVKTKKIASPDEGTSDNYVLVNDLDTLLYIVNLGCIEIDPWNGRVGKINNPDYMIFDLDPEDVSFAKVCQTALAVKKVLDELGLKSFCKTSGKRGIHIFVPTGAKYTTEQVKNWAKKIAREVNSRLPNLTSVERSPAKRQKKVYIDFLQNRTHQSVCAAYSVRPVEGATVSAPLKWGEVNEHLSPKNFTIKNMPERVKKVGDLWAGVLRNGADLTAALKKVKINYFDG